MSHQFFPHVPSNMLILLLCSFTSHFTVASACHYHQESPIAFTAQDHKDTLHISVDGDDCDHAELTLQVITASHQIVYDFHLPLQEMLPMALSGSTLEAFIPTYINRLLKESTSRSSQDLIPYTDPVDFYQNTNDFVTIDPQAYDVLRHLNQAVIWHTTGDSSWVHVVYDGKEDKSMVIMRGGIFTQ